MNQADFIVERVHCCVCNGSGKLPKLIFWTKPCEVCDGAGKRMILIHKALSPADMMMVRQLAITGSLNYAPRSLSKALFGFDLMTGR